MFLQPTSRLAPCSPTSAPSYTGILCISHPRPVNPWKCSSVPSYTASSLFAQNPCKPAPKTTVQKTFTAYEHFHVYVPAYPYFRFARNTHQDVHLSRSCPKLLLPSRILLMPLSVTSYWTSHLSCTSRSSQIWRFLTLVFVTKSSRPMFNL